MQQDGVMKINNSLEPCKVIEQKSVLVKHAYFNVKLKTSRLKNTNKTDRQYFIGYQGNYLSNNKYHKLDVKATISSFVEINSYDLTGSAKKRYRLSDELKSIVLDNFDIGILSGETYVLINRNEVFITKDFEAKGNLSKNLYGYVVAGVPEILCSRIANKFSKFAELKRG